jgi:hypothetical protein
MSYPPSATLFSTVDIGAIENSRRAIDESWRLLRQPVWPCDPVPSTIEILCQPPIAAGARDMEAPSAEQPSP